MIGKSIFNAKFTITLFMAVLFTAALVAAGCSSSDKTEKTDEAEVTETVEVEVKEAPQEEGKTEAAPTPAPTPDPIDKVRHSGPPQEILDACVGLNIGDECTISLSSGDIAGTCKKISSGDTACMPRPRPGKSSQEKSSGEAPADDWHKQGGGWE